MPKAALGFFDEHLISLSLDKLVPVSSIVQLYKGPQLRQWQEEAISAWDKHHYGIIQAVPGAGKTILAVKMLTQKLETEPNLKVIIVCPRLTLIQQWVDAIIDNTNISREEIYEVSSHNEPLAYSRAQGQIPKYKVFISTFRQIRQFLEQDGWKDYDWFLIVDEMHNTSENYKFPNSPIKYKLGLSATPKKKNRDADFDLGGIVHTYSFSQALNDKIILDPVIKIVFYSVNENLFKKIQNTSDPTTDLIESAYDDFLPDSEISEEKKHLEKRQETEFGKALTPQEQFEEDQEEDLFTSRNTDFLGIQRILEEQFKIGKPDSFQTLVFVNRIKKANILNMMLAERFNERVSHSYHSKSEKYNSKNHFNELKKEFADGKFNVLISVGTLGEGIDFPYASHGIIASPIYNPTSFVQKVGRLLRSYKDHKKAVIYYYVPSELITRLLTDERIEPNYFKAVIKIADENDDLYFVDRKSLKEEKGSLADLLIQGAAYERNEDIARIKMPHDLDSILRFFKRVYPETLKDWKKFYSTQAKENKREAKKKSRLFAKKTDTDDSEKKAEPEIDFTELREEIAKYHSIMLSSAKILVTNLEGVTKVQKKFSERKFKDFKNVKEFVKEALNHRLTTKIKYGHELERIATDKKSVLSLSEQEMLGNIVSAEMTDFCSKEKDLKKTIISLKNATNMLEKTAKAKQGDTKAIEERISAMNRIAKIFFDLQSMFLDELEMQEMAKNALTKDVKFTLTIGRDIFLTKHIARKYSFPEDFGLSRWREEKEVPAPTIELKGIEKFAKRLMHMLNEEKKVREDYYDILGDWEGLKAKICSDLKISIQTDDHILKELEKHKHEDEFSFEDLFFVTETIKRKKKN
ncbi:MAG: DEAD/DEAH box helicase family protein [archaeon]